MTDDAEHAALHLDPLDGHVRLEQPAAAARSSSPPAITTGSASAEGNGAIDALYRAVDKALAEVLDGHPRLLAYDIHALGEGPTPRAP